MNINRTQEDFVNIAGRFGKMRYGSLFCNISRREYEMLAVMEHYMEENTAKKGIYVSELAKVLRVSPPAVSRMIRTLEERGYINRDVDRNDRRNTYVYLTEDGINTKKQNGERMRRLMERVIIRMGEKDMKEIIMLWNRLADIMEEELEGEK